MTKEKVEIKLKEILPHPQRTKRGLINGLGSIFKSISGNLDAADGERYDNLIRQIQNNQNKLAAGIAKQNSISTDIINKFNLTIQQISHNEKALQSEIERIAAIAEQNLKRKNSNFIKDILNQIINMYEIINSILQDIENSITFTRLNIMHPSIIKTVDLFKELLKLKKNIQPGQLPFEVTLQNTLLAEKLIEIECYILNNKITYLLRLPIMYPETFNYYHLYPIPVYSQSQFKAIIPNNKYLLKNKLYFTFESDKCTKLAPQYFACKKLDIKEIDENSPCEIQLLDIKNTSACKRTQIKITRPIIKQLEESTQWIGMFPSKQAITMKCQQQEEVQKLIGTYLINIPIGCEVITAQEKINNKEQALNQNEPIFFPQLDQERNPAPYQNFTIHLENINLDELQDIKKQIVENQPQIFYDDVGISHIPSTWTLLLYVLVISLISYFLYKKLISAKRSNIKEDIGGNRQEEITLPNVQLPRCTP